MHLHTHLYEMASRAAQIRDGVIILIADNDEASIPRPQLLYDALHLGVHPIPGGYHNDGHVLVHQGQRAMLHFSSQNALAVHQCNLLHLNRQWQH